MQIFSFYGIIGDFTWESPNYSISLVLLSSCALVAAWIGAYQKSQSREHGVILFLVFLVTSIVQYEYNSEFPQQEGTSACYPSESHAHTDSPLTLTRISLDSGGSCCRGQEQFLGAKLQWLNGST